ncbi:hypothetical protein ACFU8Q_40930 [Streptomyces sp. NPDC057543]|uniref:hypothetical protein n=1 Tax=Streptomyces sp. NPDC057543 TaxID=3346163 RepID=UPI0036B3B219
MIRPVVVANPGFDEFVELADLQVESDHLLRQRVHHLRDQSLAEQAGVLTLGGFAGRLRELVGIANAAVA